MAYVYTHINSGYNILQQQPRRVVVCVYYYIYVPKDVVLMAVMMIMLVAAVVVAISTKQVSSLRLFPEEELSSILSVCFEEMFNAKRYCCIDR